MKVFKTVVFTALVLFAGTLFWPGCTKVDTDISYEVTAYLRLPEVTDLVPFSPYIDIFVHQGVDTAEWWVTSYENARTGVISNKETGEEKQSDAQGVLSADRNNILVGPFTGGKVMLVAYDREKHGEYQSKLYGWRQIQIEPGVSLATIPVIFKPDDRGWINAQHMIRNPDSRVYTDSKWMMANDNPVPDDQ